MRQQKTYLPRLHPIVWSKCGCWGTQVFWLSAGCTVELDNKGLCTGMEVVPTDVIQRGYVKIWRRGVNVKQHVVDRALTVTAAKRRIEYLKGLQA